MSRRVRDYKEIGEVLDAEVKHCSVAIPKIWRAIDSLGTTTAFKRTTSSRPARLALELLRFLLAARRLRLWPEKYSRTDIVKAYYVITDTDGAKLAAASFEEHPGHALVQDLVARLREDEASRRNTGQAEDVTFSVGDAGVISVNGADLFAGLRPPPAIPAQVTQLASRSDSPRSDLLQYFWAPYLNPESPTLIAFGLPLFSRDTSDPTTYTRRGKLVTEAELYGHITAKGLSERMVRPYVTRGDALCTIALLQWLGSRNVPVSARPFAVEEGLEALRDHLKEATPSANIIALGSTRLTGVIAPWHSRAFDGPRSFFPFRTNHDGVFEVDEMGQEFVPPREWKDRWTSDGEELVAALVSRRPGDEGGYITCISSTSSRVVEAIGQFLTTEVLLRRFLEKAKLLERVTALPSRFQVVLTMTVDADGEYVSRSRVLAVWDGDADHFIFRESHTVPAA